MGAHAESPDTVRDGGFRRQEDDGDTGSDQILSQGETVFPGHHDVQQHQGGLFFPQRVTGGGRVFQFLHGVTSQLKMHSCQPADIHFIFYQKDRFHNLRNPFILNCASSLYHHPEALGVTKL